MRPIVRIAHSNVLIAIQDPILNFSLAFKECLFWLDDLVTFKDQFHQTVFGSDQALPLLHSGLFWLLFPHFIDLVDHFGSEASFLVRNFEEKLWMADRQNVARFRICE